MTKNEKDIIELFKSENNNTIKEISEKLNLGYMVVCRCLNRYLEGNICELEETFIILESKMNNDENTI